MNTSRKYYQEYQDYLRETSKNKKKCWVKDCKDRTSIRHRFPRMEPEIYKVWLTIVKPEGYETFTEDKIYTKFRVCHAHFKEDDILKGSFKRGLKACAIPVLNIPGLDPKYAESLLNEALEQRNRRFLSRYDDYLTELATPEIRRNNLDRRRQDLLTVLSDTISAQDTQQPTSEEINDVHGSLDEEEYIKIEFLEDDSQDFQPSAVITTDHFSPESSQGFFVQTTTLASGKKMGVLQFLNDPTSTLEVKTESSDILTTKDPLILPSTSTNYLPQTYQRKNISTCGQCSEDLRGNLIIKCDGECKKQFHAICANISEQNLNCLKAIEGAKWFCVRCRKKR